MIKVCKGRLSSLPFLFHFYKKETITIQLFNERITVFPDGTMKRSNMKNFAPKREP
jgi:hypothetical protein